MKVLLDLVAIDQDIALWSDMSVRQLICLAGFGLCSDGIVSEEDSCISRVV